MTTRAEQELLVLDDLLYAMMGVDGRYISAWKGPDVSRGLD